jgi:uncharacterized protein
MPNDEREDIEMSQATEVDRAEGESGEKSEMESSEDGEDRRSRRGFAAMSEEKRRSIASKGGRSQGKHNNPGNFANDRKKAVAAGARGGQHSHGGGRRSEDSEE